MKKLTYITFLFLVFSCKSKDEINEIAEISCGQCKFELQGDGCDLAVKIKDKTYYVEGFGIDDFGDAHDENTGFCNVVRKGKIKGFVRDGKFVASSITLVK